MSSQEQSHETSETQVQQTISGGTPSPWPVEAIRAAASGSCQLPDRAAAILVVRVGQPHGRARGGWKKDVHFDVAEGYAVFREKCLAKFTEVSTSPDALRRPIQLPENGADIYFKKARNDSQERYVRLSSENFAATLLHRWSLLTQNDLARLGDFRFEVFLYVERAAPPEQFHRATAQRVENARVQRMAYEAANAVNFGTITAHHLDVVHAKRPDNTAFEIPTDNTTTQAIALDQQREDIRRADVAAAAERQTGEVMIRLNGLWMPVKVDIISVRRAIGLPDHDIFTQGIFHQFNAEAPSNPTMPDTDHQDDEAMEEV